MSTAQAAGPAQKDANRWRLLATYWGRRWPIPVILMLIVLMMVPMLLALFIAGKSRAQFDFNPWGLTFPIYYHQTFPAAWRVVSQSILNSVIVSAVSCVGVLFFGSLSAYVFARFDFLGKDTVFVFILSLLMIPAILTLVPRFVVVHKLGLFQTMWALLLPYIAAGQVMAVFLMRTFFASIPSEYFESARIDGASEFRCFWNIALPLSKHIAGVVAILQVLGTWNDIFWPYLTIGTKKELFTIPVALLIFDDQLGQQIGTQMAGYIIASLPLVLLFAFTSRLFVEGLTAGGLKL